MFIENQKKLFEKYPTIFNSTKVDPASPSPFNFFGIECGDGWYNLLDGLLRTITSHEKYAKKNDAKYVPIKVLQIKEKFGGLRFYYSGGDEFISGVVTMAEAMSERTCDVCGDVGKLRDTGWLATRCETHINGVDNV